MVVFVIYNCHNEHRAVVITVVVTVEIDLYLKDFLITLFAIIVVVVVNVTFVVVLLDGEDEVEETVVVMTMTKVYTVKINLIYFLNDNNLNDLKFSHMGNNVEGMRQVYYMDTISL